MALDSTAEQTLSRILICDDDARVLSSTRALLNATGLYRTDIANSGVAALQQLEKNNYDLLLLDLNMPGMSGQEVLEQLRAGHAETSILVISGEQTIESAVNALRAGAKDFLRKPYAPEELLSRVKITLREHHLEREHRRTQRHLRESERLHRFFVDNSPDLIFLLDGQGRFVFVNHSAEKLLGHPQSSLLGKHYRDLVHPDDQGQAAYRLLTGTAERRAQNIELRFMPQNPESEPRMFEAHSAPVDLEAMGLSSGMGVGIYGVARDVSEHRKAEQIITYQASHDLLTRLPNRILFRDRLALALKQAQRSHSRFAVMCLDLDRFKMVNDTLGHVVGDELLQSVASRMNLNLREGDTLARLGGDEFLLLLPQAGTEDAAEKFARRLLTAIEQPFQIGEHELFVTASLGISLFPDHGSTADSLTQCADVAMYAVKNRNRRGYQLYQPSIDSDASHKLRLTTDLHHALGSGQLSVHYQPQVESQTLQIRGMEALVRWQHPKLGLLSPGEFLPIAEDAGLMPQIGEWVLRRSCEDLQRWRAAGIPDIRIAVNFSAVQVEQPEFVEVVLRTLSEFGIPPHLLEVEVTEDGIMKDMQSVVEKFTLLAQQGIRIAIDDFGTGYSSLSYLRSLPIHTLKIDRSFMQDVRDADGSSNATQNSIVSAIVHMANGLSLNAIAEGVETESQLDLLRTLGCGEMQGYLFSKPVHADAMQALLMASLGQFPASSKNPTPLHQ